MFFGNTIDTHGAVSGASDSRKGNDRLEPNWRFSFLLQVEQKQVAALAGTQFKDMHGSGRTEFQGFPGPL